MDPTQPAPSRRRTTAILAAAGLACLAIAIPVSGAFGADESGSAGSQTQTQQGYGPPGQGQPPEGQPPEGQPPRGGPDGDCPKDRGQDEGGSGESSAPGVPDDSVQL